MGWKLYMEIIQVERRTQKQQSKAKPKGREEMEKGCIPFPVMQAMQATLRPQYNHNTMKKERKKKRQFMAARAGSIAGQGRAAPESIQNVCSLFFPLLPPHPLYLPSLSLSASRSGTCLTFGRSPPATATTATTATTAVVGSSSSFAADYVLFVYFWSLISHNTTCLFSIFLSILF